MKKWLFVRCFYGYMVSGMAVLVFGAILPSLIDAAGLSYLMAGGLLSIMAVGNFLASFIFPVLVAALGRRRSISMTAALVPTALFILTLLPPVPVMYVLMFAAGIGRGSITILNNGVVNDYSGEARTKMLNYLHCSFAVGAFTAPFLTGLLITLGLGWRSILYIIVVLCISSTISYASTEYDGIEMPDADQESPVKKVSALQSGGTVKNTVLPVSKPYYKRFDFYCIGFILFFYLGVENCVNGWFVTYLKSTGVMSEAFAASLVSVVWVFIMAGCLLCAYLSSKMLRSTLILMSTFGSALAFFLLVTSNSLPIITVALILFGFSLSGIYPTCVANAGPLIQGSTAGMSVLTAISAAGGIVTPQIVGFAADYIGIVAAIGILTLNIAMMIILALTNSKKNPM